MAEKPAAEPLKDASDFYEVERRETHLERPGFRVNELVLGPTHCVPWHAHSTISDTFYVIDGRLGLFLRDPRENMRLDAGQTFTVAPGRPHLVTNAGETSVTFLVLQGVGEYDFVPLT